MGTKYTTESLTGYNTSPPSDDGTAADSNKVNWGKHKDKLGDPLKTQIANIDSKLVTMADVGPDAKAVNYTTVAADHEKTIEVTAASVTITLLAVASAPEGYTVRVKNNSGTTTEVDATGAETIDGSTGAIMLADNESTIIQLDSAQTGYITLQQTAATITAAAQVYKGSAAGTADVITCSLTPTLTALTDGTVCFVRAFLANATTTPTINIDGLGAKTITKNGNQALVAGDIARINDELILRYNSANSAWELLNPAPFLQSESILSNGGHISGLVLSNDTDTAHDINITAGYANSSDNTTSMNLSAEMTKQIDATWAAGDDAGGLFSGTVGNTTWYYVFLIEKDSDGSIDAGFDTSLTAANIPAGYTAYRRIGAVLTDGTANILGFSDIENAGGVVDREWNVTIIDRSGAGSGTTRTLLTVSCPPDSKGHFSTLYGGASAWIKSTSATDAAASATNFTIQTANGNTVHTVAVDSSSQVAFRTSTTDQLTVLCLGYSDRRL